MNIPEHKILEIKLGEKLRLIRLSSGKIAVYGGEYGLFYSSYKGDMKHKDYPVFETFDGAYEFSRKITEYFVNPLSQDCIIEWYNSIIEDEDENDIQTYSHFKDCLLNGDWTAANEAAYHMDTFLRDGISDRIMFEIEKNLNIS